MARVAGVVLAAGAGRRMGRPKAEIVVDGVRLLDRALHTLRAGGCDPLYAVVRSGTDVDLAVGDTRAIVNPDPDRGMRSSLACALAGTDGADIDTGALAVLLVDTPGVGSGAVTAVVDAWRPGRVAVATFAGRRGHPIVMSRAQWRTALAAAAADEGARRYLRAHPDLVDEIAVPGDAADLDTPADLARWTRPAGPAAGQ